MVVTSVVVVSNASAGINITSVTAVVTAASSVGCSLSSADTAKAAQIIAIKAVIINKLIFFISFPPYL